MIMEFTLGETVREDNMTHETFQLVNALHDQIYNEGYEDGVEAEKAKYDDYDTISRKLAIDRASYLDLETGEKVEEMLKELPNICLKEKVGYWNTSNNFCSVCGEDRYEGIDADIYSDWFPQFCPNCGAKMEVRD